MPDSIIDKILNIKTSKDEYPGSARKKQYKSVRQIGSGSFGVVKEAVHIQSGKHYAIKSIRKKSLHGSSEALKMVHREMSILRDVRHPNIVNMIDSFETRDKFYLVLELATGGELFERLAQRGKFTEKDAASIVYPILDAIEELHSHGIVHRDLKPENILYKDSSEDSPVVIADFGVSNVIKENEMLTSLAGSPGYASPEVLRRTGHSKPADIWSIGCLTYTILCGFHPFYYCEDLPDLIDAVTKGKWKFESPYWDNISHLAKSFIKSCLILKPSARPTAAQAKLHPWLVKYCYAAKDNARRYLAEQKKLKEAGSPAFSGVPLSHIGKTLPVPPIPTRIESAVESKEDITYLSPNRFEPSTSIDDSPNRKLSSGSTESKLSSASSSENLNQSHTNESDIIQNLDYISDEGSLPNLAEQVWAASPAERPDEETLAAINATAVKESAQGENLASEDNQHLTLSTPASGPVKRKITFKNAAKFVAAATKFEAELANARQGLLAIGLRAAARRAQINQNSKYLDVGDDDSGLSSGASSEIEPERDGK